MSEKLTKVKKELAKTKVMLRSDLDDKTRKEYELKEEELKQELHFARLEEMFDRMELRNDDKHKRRWKIK